MNLNSDIQVITPESPCQAPQQALIGQSSRSGSGSPSVNGKKIASLVNYVPSSELTANFREKSGDFKPQKEWSRQMKRGYQRIMSILNFWEGHEYQIMWLCLTSSRDSEAKLLAEHHDKLKKYVERRFGFEGIEHVSVKTTEGQGVLHILWAWKPKQGFRGQRFFVGQRWLSEKWQEIHRAKVVWISKVDKSIGSKKKLSRYCVTHYCAEQNGYKYMSWSWRRSFGFPMVASWRWFKGMSRGDKPHLLKKWSQFMRGERVVVYFRQSYSSIIMDMNILRKLYVEFGKELWNFT